MQILGWWSDRFATRGLGIADGCLEREQRRPRGIGCLFAMCAVCGVWWYVRRLDVCTTPSDPVSLLQPCLRFTGRWCGVPRWYSLMVSLDWSLESRFLVSRWAARPLGECATRGRGRTESSVWPWRWRWARWELLHSIEYRIRQELAVVVRVRNLSLRPRGVIEACKVCVAPAMRWYTVHGW